MDGIHDLSGVDPSFRPRTRCSQRRDISSQPPAFRLFHPGERVRWDGV